MGIEVLRVLAFGSVKDDGDDPATDGGGEENRTKGINSLI